MRRTKDNPNTYEVKTDRARYAVTLERLGNTTAGCPRFKATIIVIEVFGEEKPFGSFYSVGYTFKGHYSRDIDECRFIVEAYEESLKK